MSKLEEYRYLVREGNDELARHHVRLNASELIAQLKAEEKHPHPIGSCEICVELNDLGWNLLNDMQKLMIADLVEIKQRVARLGDALSS